MTTTWVIQLHDANPFNGGTFEGYLGLIQHNLRYSPVAGCVKIERQALRFDTKEEAEKELRKLGTRMADEFFARFDAHVEEIEMDQLVSEVDEEWASDRDYN